MQLKINNTAADLFEEQEIIIQQNSPLVSFKLQGDKTYSFNIPSSESLKKEIGAIGHVQKTEVSNTNIGKVQASGQTAITGKVKIRKSNDRATTLDIIAAPGGMDAAWWSSSANSLDLGSDAFLTKEETVDILLIKFDWVLEDYTNNGGGKVTILDALQYRGRYRLSFFDGNTLIFSFIFQPNYSVEKRDMTAWVSECQMEFDSISTELMYFQATEQQISVMRDGMNTLNFKIRIENINSTGNITHTYEVSQYQPIKYLSILPGSRKIALKTKPYFFPTIANKSFYGEKTGSTLAINQKDSAGELILNSQLLRTKYPISPCFRWKWVFSKIAELMGLSLNETDWNNWKDLSFCAMVDMAEQCPMIAMPFNTYQNIIKYADYLPIGYTIKDIFEEFALLTGITWDFDLTNKQLRLIQIDPIFDAQPQVIEAESLDLRDGINYEDIIRYKLNYSTVIEAEKVIAPTGYFDDMPILKDGFQLLNMKLLPLVPVRIFGKLFGSQCLSVGRSIFFDLKEQTPPTRVFFYNSELEQALTEMNNISLSRTDANGLYEKFWKRMINRKKGKKLTARGIKSLIEYLNLDFFRILHHRGVSFLINQKQIKLRNNRKVHEVEIEIEIIS